MVFFLSCVCYASVRCGHLLGKGLLHGFRLWCLTVSLSLSHWYSGSDDCIDSLSLHPYLLRLHLCQILLEKCVHCISFE